MKTWNLVRRTAICAACAGVIVPQAGFAVEPASQQVAPVVAVSDVRLAADGMFRGQVVDSQGLPMADTQVTVLSMQSQVVATTKTNRDGHFAVAGLTGGVYQLQAGQASSMVRLWSTQMAPPSAKDGILLVSGQVQRGQQRWVFQDGKWVMIGIGAGVITAGLISGQNNNNNNNPPSSGS